MNSISVRNHANHLSRPAFTPGSADPPPWGGAYAPPRRTALRSALIGCLVLEGRA